jgi:hypothetical protein
MPISSYSGNSPSRLAKRCRGEMRSRDESVPSQVGMVPPRRLAWLPCSASSYVHGALKGLSPVYADLRIPPIGSKGVVCWARLAGTSSPRPEGEMLVSTSDFAGLPAPDGTLGRPGGATKLDFGALTWAP